MNVQQYFEQNGYAILSNALPPEELERLTQHMFNLHNQGKLVRDSQCPESDAVYGDPEFDKLLEKFAKPIGDNVGKTLLPTYSYARIYRPGEILKRHTDRPACEISSTLTLGFDAENPWPIFFDENQEIRVDMVPGEMAVYKGCDIAHWRKPFKGNWHVQVFLHYVDANGPFKDEAYDKRPKLGLEADTRSEVSNNNRGEASAKNEDIEVNEVKHHCMVIPCGDNKFPGYIHFNSECNPRLMFTKEECHKLISTLENSYPSPARVGGGAKPEREIRSAEVYDIGYEERFKWLYDKIGFITSVANSGHFNYEIAGVTHGLQLLKYDASEDVPGHYKWHTDAGPGTFCRRKISLVVQLSDPSDYEGCELEVMEGASTLIAPKEQGTVCMFPSYTPHRVTPIEKGIRYSLVIWVEGSRRFT